MSRLYITLFDKIQFYIIEDLTDLDKNAMWATLKNQAPVFPNGVREMLTYAANSDQTKGIEIWTFQSDLKRPNLWDIAKEQPFEFIDLIRQEGNFVFAQKVKEPV